MSASDVDGGKSLRTSRTDAPRSRSISFGRLASRMSTREKSPAWRVFRAVLDGGSRSLTVLHVLCGCSSSSGVHVFSVSPHSAQVQVAPPAVAPDHGVTKQEQDLHCSRRFVSSVTSTAGLPGGNWAKGESTRPHGKDFAKGELPSYSRKELKRSAGGATGTTGEVPGIGVAEGVSAVCGGGGCSEVVKSMKADRCTSPRSYLSRRCFLYLPEKA